LLSISTPFLTSDSLFNKIDTLSISHCFFSRFNSRVIFFYNNDDFNIEYLIKQLNENKEIRKLQEKIVKPAVRIQQVKNNLIILAHDLLVSKKVNDVKQAINAASKVAKYGKFK
jgi:hypothetical protein